MNEPVPLLSIVIPGYNRPEPLKYTLRSVAAAAARVPARAVEVIAVDDGSAPPLADQLTGFEPRTSVTFLRQENRGSIAARLSGLGAANGRYVLFLDSDDLVHPDKFVRQLEAIEATHADVVYADMAIARAGADYAITRWQPGAVLPVARDPADLYIKIQPAPHNPIYRREYLCTALACPVVTPRREIDASGDVWLFYNLSIHPASIRKIAGHYTAPGPHEEFRFSRNWEKLGVASLLIMEEFLRRCPPGDSTRAARVAAGELAFHTWRGLPRDFHAGFERKMLAIWQRSPKGRWSRLGSGSFAALAHVVGPVRAARLLRAYRSRPYAAVRTLDDEAYARLVATLE